jgi:hypothetical protein
MEKHGLWPAIAKAAAQIERFALNEPPLLKLETRIVVQRRVSHNRRIKGFESIGLPSTFSLKIENFNNSSSLRFQTAASLSQFFDSMPGILPCKQCGKHLKENLAIFPFDRSDPFRWSVDLHNLVNSQLNKPEIDYDKAFRYWSARCSGGPSHQNIVLVLIAILVILFVLYKFKS